MATGNAYQLRMHVGRGLLRHAEEEGQHVVVRPVRTSEHPGRHDGRSLRGMFLGGYCLCNILLVLLLVSLRCSCFFVPRLAGYTIAAVAGCIAGFAALLFPLLL